MEYEQLRVRKANRVALCSIYNPPLNLMTDRMVEELDALIQELAADDSVRVVVFTGGVEGVFITHFDVSELVRPLRPRDACRAAECAGDAASSHATAIARPAEARHRRHQRPVRWRRLRVRPGLRPPHHGHRRLRDRPAGGRRRHPARRRRHPAIAAAHRPGQSAGDDAPWQSRRRRGGGAHRSRPQGRARRRPDARRHGPRSNDSPRARQSPRASSSAASTRAATCRSTKRCRSSGRRSARRSPAKTPARR